MKRAVPVVVLLLLLCINAFSQDHFPEVLKAANKGDTNAQNELGVMYANGDGVPQDFKRAAYWCQKSADHGNKYAQNNLGTLYENGQGVAVDIQQAISLYRQSAEQGDAGAQNNLGRLYELGKGVPKDIQQATEWYLKGAENGDSNAQSNLARIAGTNSIGIDTDKMLRLAEDQYKAHDYKSATDSYRKAAAMGSSAAEYRLYELYSFSEDAEPDLTEKQKLQRWEERRQIAFSYLRKSAEHGYPDAEAAWGGIICDALYQRQSEHSLVCTDVIPMLKDAAEKGVILAQTTLGDIYSGQNQSSVEAHRKWDKEHPDAAPADGNFPKYQDFPTDCSIGLKWYRQAAIQDSPYAIGAIGTLYKFGMCLPYDDKRAWGWLRLAQLTAKGDYAYSPMHKDAMKLAEMLGVLRTATAKQQALQLAKAELARLKEKH